jgi:excisionase family DNA binding protein
MTNTKLLLSKKDAASALSVSVRTVENLIARKELVARRIGGRTLVPATVLETFVKRDHETQPRRVTAAERIP